MQKIAAASDVPTSASAKKTPGKKSPAKKSAVKKSAERVYSTSSDDAATGSGARTTGEVKAILTEAEQSARAADPHKG